MPRKTVTKSGSATATLPAPSTTSAVSSPTDYYLPLPEITSDAHRAYGVRIEGQKGIWPAQLIEQSTVPLVDPTRRNLYPDLKPGEQRPAAVFEEPAKNVIGHANMRGWKILGGPGGINYEDPRAAAGTHFKFPIVGIYAFCPADGTDRKLGTYSPHGSYVCVNQDGDEREKLRPHLFQDPEAWPYEPGRCPKCKTPQEQANAAERIDQQNKGLR